MGDHRGGNPKITVLCKIPALSKGAPSALVRRQNFPQPRWVGLGIPTVCGPQAVLPSRRSRVGLFGAGAAPLPEALLPAAPELWSGRVLGEQTLPPPSLSAAPTLVQT